MMPAPRAVSCMMSEAVGVNIANPVVARSRHDGLVANIDFAIERSKLALLAQQHPEGYWERALEAHAEMNAAYVIFNRFMELPPVSELDRTLAKQNFATQRRGGSLGPSLCSEHEASGIRHFATSLARKV